MAENRLIHNLETARTGGRKCLMPYLTAGYPDLDTTIGLLRRFSDAGCDAVEIGIPFSDSIADGPIIQESFYRVLDGGFRVARLFEEIAAVRDRVSAAMLAMVSMSIVRRCGVESFAARLAESGFDGAIVPDVPVDESAELSRVLGGAGLCNILMAAPTSSAERCREIARHSTGFIYMIAARGITGERNTVDQELADHIRDMRALTRTPLIAGFGISTPEQARQVCQAADGVIVGSAVIRRITRGIEEGLVGDALIERIGAYVDDMLRGTRPPEA